MSTSVPEYNSVMANWDSKSTVRKKPRRVLSDSEQEIHFFPAALTPSANHQLVTGRGADAVHELLTRRLYTYLDFTAVLEQEVVNPAVLQLSRNAYGLAIPESMKFDAYKIYCDEAYHALFSMDMKNQVAIHTGVTPRILENPPRFMLVIQRVKDSLPSELSGLAELCAAVVCETLISGSLMAIPADVTVARSVREVMADHVIDERVHHAYFTRVLEVMWPQLDLRTKRLLAPHFADFVLAFLTPDENAQRQLLHDMNFSSEQISQIFCESYPPAKTQMELRGAAKLTLSLFERVGVLEDSLTRERFAEAGLLP